LSYTSIYTLYRWYAFKPLNECKMWITSYHHVYTFMWVNEAGYLLNYLRCSGFLMYIFLWVCIVTSNLHRNVPIQIMTGRRHAEIMIFYSFHDNTIIIRTRRVDFEKLTGRRLYGCGCAHNTYHLYRNDCCTRAFNSHGAQRCVVGRLLQS